MKTIYGKKLGMSRVFTKDGSHIPVSVVKVSRNVIVRIKDETKDNSNSIVIGYGEQKESRLTKAYKGQFKDSVKPTRYLRELKKNEGEEYKVGDEIKLSDFEEGKKVDVTGISKGKGTQGNIKRHGHARGPMSHGSKHKRLVGALAGASYPGRVFKGNKGPGRMGRDTVTIQGLPIVKIYEDRELILIKGAIPGNNDSIVKISYSVKGGEKKYDLLEATVPTATDTKGAEDNATPKSKEDLNTTAEKTADAKDAADKEADKPADNAEAKPEDKPADNSADKPADKPADNKTDEKNADKPADKKPEETKEEKAADAPKTDDKPADNSADKKEEQPAKTDEAKNEEAKVEEPKKEEAKTEEAKADAPADSSANSADPSADSSKEENKETDNKEKENA